MAVRCCSVHNEMSLSHFSISVTGTSRHITCRMRQNRRNVNAVSLSSDKGHQKTAVTSKFNVHCFGSVPRSFLVDGERQPNLSGVEHDQLDRFVGRETTMRRLHSFRHRLPRLENRAFSSISFFQRKMSR